MAENLIALFSDLIQPEDSSVVVIGDSKDGELDKTANQTGPQKTLPNGKPLPTKFLVFRFGKNPFTKDGEDSEFEADESDADNAISDFQKRQRPIVIDWEHKTLSGDEAPAAGWIKDLIKDKDGLYGVVENWTPRAQDQLVNGEYGSVSPVIQFDPNTKRPKAVHSISLTNHPSLHNPVNFLAASDLKLKSENFKKAMEVFKTAHSVLSDITSEVCGAHEMAAKFAAGNPELEMELKAFTDSIEGLKSFADGDATSAAVAPAAPAITPSAPVAGVDDTKEAEKEVLDSAATLSAKDFQALAGRKIAGAANADVKRVWESGLANSMANEIEQEPLPAPAAVAEATKPAVAPVAPSTTSQPQPTPVQQPMTDISRDHLKAVAGLLGLGNTASFSDIAGRINGIKEVGTKVFSLMQEFGVQSFADLAPKIKEGFAKRDKEIEDFKNKLALSDNERIIDNYVRQGKISNGSRDIELRVLTKLGKSDYEELMDKRPVVVPMSDSASNIDLSTLKMGEGKPAPAGWNELASAMGLDGVQYDGPVINGISSIGK